ncbi:CGNR zinc finger domain-containing protein [Nocardioides kribbensis]|uniref:CGNR zinc finger domain-containing protein n=1 Tax=Nocardioides kribbensis TaxID=305517 RepID=UPI00187A5D12|nr:CGNR zinc finger domain-containing protein [Nocardioides kribbensis]
MDVAGHAEQAARLVNATVLDVDDLVAVLSERPSLAARVTDRDCMLVRRLQRDLDPVFRAAAEGRDAAAVEALDALLAAHPVTPRLTPDPHAPSGLRLAVGGRSDAVAEQLLAESLVGLATLVADLGAARLGVCGEPRCSQVWVDTSSNRSRRYCSGRCASRVHVAAHRARRRTPA